jgi:hypothetical protein
MQRIYKKSLAFSKKSLVEKLNIVDFWKNIQDVSVNVMTFAKEYNFDTKRFILKVKHSL